jgi:hypothetical protein
MPSPKNRAAIKTLLKGASKVLMLVAALVFLIGDRVFMEFAKLDFILAEFLGIGSAVICGIIAMVLHHKIEDIEWKEENEIAEREASAARASEEAQPKP